MMCFYYKIAVLGSIFRQRLQNILTFSVFSAKIIVYATRKRGRTLYTVGLYTLGCKVSQYETEAVGEQFEKMGFEILPFDSRCDVYVINTCTVTAESDRKSRQFIRRAIKANPDAVVLVMGCYSQRAPGEVAKIAGVSAVVGTENKLSLVSVAEKLLADKRLSRNTEQYISTTDVTKADFEDMCITRAPRTRAYVKIEDGCESKCTYCAISGARGRVRSKKEDVIREVEALYRTGVREIVLTGIETASYGRDFSEKYGLADLICELDARHSCERIRLGSLAPELIDEEFVTRVRDKAILAPHFHLSVQSGSSSVLRRMKRRYNAERAMQVIKNIRENIQDATFTTDLMVGFPGETEEEFLETLDFVKEARFLDAHVFAYSRREGTPAAYYDGQIPEQVKHERSSRLIEAKNATRDALLDEIVRGGGALFAIAESASADSHYSGHTDTFVEVKFFSEQKDLSGEIVKLAPVSHNNGVVLCEIIKKI